jgi:galactose mutarotase-like enzyme
MRFLKFSSGTKAPAQGFGFVELKAGTSSVIIVPSLGGKIASLHMGGREWLWQNDKIPFAPPVDGASYVETADSGGYDECFPTVAACNLPGHIKRYGGLALPDHGELWSQSAAVRVETHDGGPRARTEWEGRRMAYRFAREIIVTPDGAVTMNYEVTNGGSEKLPFLWSAHPLLPLTAETHIELPVGSRLRVAAQHHIDLTLMGSDARWPRLRTTHGEADLSYPDGVAKRYACKVFLDLAAGHAAVVEREARLEVDLDTREVPNFGLWINKGGWAPKRGLHYMNFAFEPCIGAPDSLSEAIGAWDSAHWLAPDERRRWSLRWTAMPRTVV